MKIKDIELIPLNIPQTYETHWANGRISVAEHTLVKVIAEDGTYGIGEAVPRTGIYGETQQSIVTVLRRFLIPLLIGMETTNTELLWEKMAEVPFNFVAKGTIDVALHDLNGKLLGVPTAALLGGPYRREVPLCWVSGGSWFPREKILAETQRIMDAGYKGIKVKAGHCQQDIELAKQMRAMAPEGFQIYLDPNQLYSREELIRVGRELSGIIDAIEEPVAIWDDLARREFTQHFPEIPLLSDETTFTVSDAYRQAQLGAIRRMAIKIPRTGFTMSKKLVHLAEMNNMAAQISTQAETDLGCAAGLQMACSSRQICLPCEIAYYEKGMYPESLLVNPLVIKNGMMQLPDAPGNGVEVNWKVIDKYRIDL